MPTCTACGADLTSDARFCAACGAPAGPHTATKERKLATVLFADLVGSTELGDQDPERTRALLDSFYDAMASEIEGAGGTVEKFIGDAVMAAFGAPLAHEDHAERALHSALSMQRRLEELPSEKLALRIGVNTGEVVVGRPREGSSFVTGDAVNVAQRLEAAAAPGEILVGGRTVAAARGAFEFGEPATIDAKGKAAPVECRRLVRALSLMRPRGVRGLRRAFVGRESELDLLQATYRRVIDHGEPHLVTIMGDAGVGKTRLVREFWEWLGSEPSEPLRRTGRCLSYGQGITYWPLGEVLKEHLGILESDPPEAVRRRLESREILGLTLGLDTGGGLHPLAARDRLHEEWVDFVDELSAERPAVMLIEDLHWAEDELLDLHERVLRKVRGPVFLLGTARPELLDRRPTWGGGRRNVSLLGLEPLSESDARRLVEEVLALELPPRLREVVLERAEGNPFFVEELLSSFIDTGVLERVDGSWSARELPAGFKVPDSVQAVIASRIDLLAPREKAGLQAAAVIGRVFWPGPVRELLDGEEPDWAALEDKDFIRHRSGSSMAGEREYAIKHALTREVAYASLPKAKRARLHAAFADWLERLGEGRDDYASLLGHHYAEAVRPEDADLAWPGREEELQRLRARASEWLRRAGELAAGRCEIEEALALLHRAVELTEDELQQSRIWREIGHAHALKYDGESFWTAMQSSLKVCADRTTCGDTYSLLAFHTSTRSGMWMRRPEPELVDGWIDQALELSEPGSAAQVRALIARANWTAETAGESAREASALAEALDDAELRSYAWAARAATAFHHKRYDEACTWAERRFDLVAEISDPDHLVEMRETAVAALGSVGRYQEARRLAEEHADMSRELSPHHRLHSMSLMLEIEELVGDWERIGALEERVRSAVAANLQTPCIRNPRCLLLCAVANVHAGAEERARELDQEAAQLGMEGYAQILNPPRMRLALARGDLDEVERLLEPDMRRSFAYGESNAATRLDGLAALRAQERIEDEAPPFVVRGAYIEPFALRALGVVRGDEELIEQAQTRFRELRLDWHAAQTSTLLGA
jgi:class 3 adenylate cyclase